MRILFLIGFLIISKLFIIEKNYDFNTIVEITSSESNNSHFFMFNDDNDDYYLSFYTDWEYKKKGIIFDNKNFKKHHFEITDLTQNLKYIKSEEFFPDQKNKTFIEYYFEVVEKEIDSSTKLLNILKYKNTKKKKLQNAIDLTVGHSNITVDEKFLNHFCHGYFLNTSFKLSFALPKSITVYKNNNTTEIFQLTRLDKIDLKINFIEQ